MKTDDKKGTYTCDEQKHRHTQTHCLTAAKGMCLWPQYTVQLSNSEPQMALHSHGPSAFTSLPTKTAFTSFTPDSLVPASLL